MAVHSKTTAQSTAPQQSPARATAPAQAPNTLACSGSALSPAGLIALQRTAGNARVEKWLAQRSTPPIQAKLTVGAADDPYEREADQMADRVMRMTSATVQRHHDDEQVQAKSLVQRHHDEDMLQTKPLVARITPLSRRAMTQPAFPSARLQRHSLPPQPAEPDEEEEKLKEEEGAVQRKPDVQRAGAGSFDPGASFESKLARHQGGGNPLPGDTRAFMESRFGADFSRVRLHTHAGAAQLNREVNAQAFTHKSDVYFNAGAYSPGTASGKRLIAHELTHVIQQGSAPSRNTVACKPARVNGVIQRWNPFKKMQTKWHSAYNVRIGGQLPGIKEMGNERLREKLEPMNKQARETASASHQSTAMSLLRNEDIVDEILRIAQEDAEEKGKPVPTNADKLDFRLEFADVLVAAPDFNKAFGQYMRTNKGNTKATLLNFFAQRVFKTADVEAQTQAQQSAEFGPERRFIGLEGGSNAVSDKFWEEREGVKLNQAYLTPEQKKPFATALKAMPTVDYILKQGTEQAQQPAQGGRPAWKDGGSLVDNIKEVNDFWKLRKAFNWVFDSKRGEKRLKSKTFRRKVQSVDAMMKAIIAPEILRRIPKPALYVHSSAAQTFSAPWGFRAWASGGKELHVAYNEAASVIAHEVGHVVEEYLPMEVWHDVHLLLGARHTAAGGGGAFAGATPIITSFTEGRYGGDYVTGKYTSTAYKGGNAEVISMAMEFFSSPAKALELIDGDPLHAAIVLRGIKPGEYAATDSLRPYDQFLPGK
jgi:hypothetical protein